MCARKQKEDSFLTFRGTQKRHVGPCPPFSVSASCITLTSVSVGWVETLRQTFFPPPLQADLSDLEGYAYPSPIECPDITIPEIEKADTITVVLRKPGKDDDTQPKAYRPIALLNTLGKVMEAIVTNRLSYLADVHHLLPNRHTGGRKLTSTEHAMHLLLQRIYQAWSKERLLHNLRKRGINRRIIAWIASILCDRTTTLRLQEFTAPSAPIQTGIPQGSPVSPILYLFYNADLIEACKTQDTEAIGCIDDVSTLAVGPTTQWNCKTLQKINRKAEQWAVKHGS
ncbi:pol-like protein [Penicillium longicatenatum]|nr:pol-like protein [Penicillium longicatenatum]